MRKASSWPWMLVLAGTAWSWGLVPWPVSPAAEPAGRHGPVFPHAADPDYERAYSQYRQQTQSRPVVAPALGYSGEAPSGRVRQAGAGGGLAAVAGNVTSSVKRGVGKIGDFLTPDERVQRAPEPTSVYSTARPGPETFVAMARLHAEAGRLAEAEQQYVNALRADPRHLGALLGYAHLMDHAGHGNEAIRLYQQAAAAHPNEASVFNDAGLCYARNGQLNPAAAHLARAVQLQPKKALYRNNLAVVLVETGQNEQALAQLRAVHAESVARFNLGQLLLRKGESQAAAEQFSAALRADPAMLPARAWLDELARQGVQVPSPGDRVTAWHRAQARHAPADRPQLPGTDAPPAAPGPAPSAVQPAPEYGNFPVPAGRRAPVQPTREAPLPVGPAPGPLPERAVAPEPVLQRDVPPPMLPHAPGDSAGSAGPRPRTLPQPRLGAEEPPLSQMPLAENIEAPEAPEQEIAPLPPVVPPEPSVEPLPPVEDAPPP